MIHIKKVPRLRLIKTLFFLSNLQINIVVCLNGSEVSRTRTLAADETPGHYDLTKRALGMFGHNGRVLLSTIAMKY